MIGLRIIRISGRHLEPSLPNGSFALFRSVKRVKRDDIVLVDHPELGLIVRKVAAVSLKGRIGLRGISRADAGERRLGNVDPDRVVGKLAMRVGGRKGRSRAS
jgi:hypothetical protein